VENKNIKLLLRKLSICKFNDDEIKIWKDKHKGCRLPDAHGKLSDEIYLSEKYIYKLEFYKLGCRDTERKIYYLSTKYRDIIQIPFHVYEVRKIEKETNIYLYDNNSLFSYCGYSWSPDLNSMDACFIDNEYVCIGLCDDVDIKKKYSHCELVEL
jgi:hypothetical protein